MQGILNSQFWQEDPVFVLETSFGTFQDILHLSYEAILTLAHKVALVLQKLTIYTRLGMV